MNITFGVLTAALITVLIAAIIILIIRKLHNSSYPYELIECAFTKNEIGVYYKIFEIADELDLEVFPKMRLADICRVKRGTKDYYRFFSKIMSKHIDFVLCSREDYSFVLAIELDDRSHERKDRIKRDKFVDNVMKACGLEILHITNTNDLKRKIREKI